MKKYFKNILLRFMKLILIFMSITKKRYKLTKMSMNACYLELIFILLNIFSSSFTLKANLASLKTEGDKLDIDKLAPVPVDLSKLSDIVKTDVVKKVTNFILVVLF